MLPFLNSDRLVAAIRGASPDLPPLNEDHAHFLSHHPARPTAPWPLRLLPGRIGQALRAWAEQRRRERQLIELWTISPHLLRDAGIVLVRGRPLPDHLCEAPLAVINHVAAHAPDQIVAADLEFPLTRHTVWEGKAPTAARKPAPADLQA